MRMDDMILVSIDDHSIQPPDMYRRRPREWAIRFRRSCATTRASTSGCSRAESTSTPFGMAATVGWPWEEWGFTPVRSRSPGCFDVHERARDMNANGVGLSMCFPTMAGFNARTFVEAGEQEAPP